MTVDWQNIATLSIVGAAAIYLLYRGWVVAIRGKNTGCGTCSSCPSESVGERKQLVQIHNSLGDIKDLR